MEQVRILMRVGIGRMDSVEDRPFFHLAPCALRLSRILGSDDLDPSNRRRRLKVRLTRLRRVDCSLSLLQRSSLRTRHCCCFFLLLPCLYLPPGALGNCRIQRFDELDPETQALITESEALILSLSSPILTTQKTEGNQPARISGQYT